VTRATGSAMAGDWRAGLLCRSAQAVVRTMLACAAVLCSVSVAAQDSDVPYVPTPHSVVEAMLGIAGVGPNDYLIDLGSGDGRIVITAAKKHGIRGFGVDLDPGLVHNAQREAAKQGVADRVAFFERNLFITDIGKATVLTAYLLPSVNLALRPRLFTELRPGTRVVSHDFDMGNWQPDRQITVPVPGKAYGPPSSQIYLWVIPADAAGQWRWRLALAGAAQDVEVRFDQTFQILSGVPAVGGRQARIERARMRGAEIEMVLVSDLAGRDVRQEYSGTLDGDTITGRVRVSGAQTAVTEWRATRTARGKMTVGSGTQVPVLARMTDNSGKEW